MSDDLFTGDNNEKGKPKANLSKKTIALSVVGSVAAIAFLGGAIFLGFNLINKNTGANDSEYQEVKKQYENHDIQYSYKDYLSDKSIVENSTQDDESEESEDNNSSESSVESPSVNLGKMSEAYNKMNDVNTKILDKVGGPLGIKDYTIDNVNNAILLQMKKTNDFIGTSYGWPSSDKYPDEYFEDWRNYINSIEKYTMGGKEPEENYYNDFTFDVQAKNLRKSAYDANQFTMVEYQDGEYPNLKKWYLTGKKSFSKIYNTTLENSDIDLSKGITSNLQANISTDNGNFKVYLTASVTNDSSGYRVLDFEAI